MVCHKIWQVFESYCLRIVADRTFLKVIESYCYRRLSKIVLDWGNNGFARIVCYKARIDVDLELVLFRKLVILVFSPVLGNLDPTFDIDHIFSDKHFIKILLDCEIS